jgi:hypothetical protein
VGKLFSETMRSGRVESLGNDELLFSSSWRRDLKLFRHAIVRFEALIASGLELRMSASSAGKLAEQDAVVWVRRDC